jgi:hypothetical protein
LDLPNWGPGDQAGPENSVTHMIVYRSRRFVDWRTFCGAGALGLGG